MAQEIDFKVEIPNLQALLQAFTHAPETAEPILQRAIVGSQLVFMQNTDEKTVPYKSTNLIHSFRFESSPLRATWGPTAKYSPFVELGTRPHLILPTHKQALFWKGAPHPVRKVNHPGSKANPFLERIIKSSDQGINSLFSQALDKITQAIADASQ